MQKLDPCTFYLKFLLQSESTVDMIISSSKIIVIVSLTDAVVGSNDSDKDLGFVYGCVSFTGGSR